MQIDKFKCAFGYAAITTVALFLATMAAALLGAFRVTGG